MTTQRPADLANPNPIVHYVIVPLSSLTIGYFTIGLCLLLQPHRWIATPAYANLIDIASSTVWGCCYLVTAALLALSVWRWRTRWLVVAAHTVAIALTGVWFMAFIIRYLTNDNTTIVTAAAWGVFLALLVQSGTALGNRR
jgi:hypothetical protein